VTANEKPSNLPLNSSNPLAAAMLSAGNLPAVQSCLAHTMAQKVTRQFSVVLSYIVIGAFEDVKHGCSFNLLFYTI